MDDRPDSLLIDDLDVNLLALVLGQTDGMARIACMFVSRAFYQAISLVVLLRVRTPSLDTLQSAFGAPNSSSDGSRTGRYCRCGRVRGQCIDLYSPALARMPIAVLEWAVQMDMTPSPSLFECAGAEGRLDVIQLIWPRFGNKTVATRAVNVAARYKHFAIVRWLGDYATFGVYAHLAYALRSIELGDLDMLVWVHERGFELGSHLCVFAHRLGHKRTVEWLNAHGCRATLANLFERERVASPLTSSVGC